DLDQLGAEEIRREEPRQQHDHDRENRAQPRDVDAEPVLGLPGIGQQEQRLVEHVDDDLQDPQRDDKGDPDQKHGNEVLLEGDGMKRPGWAGPWSSRARAQAEASDLDSVFFSGLASLFDSDLSSVFFSAGLELLFLKSVAYQPLPLS